MEKIHMFSKLICTKTHLKYFHKNFVFFSPLPSPFLSRILQQGQGACGARTPRYGSHMRPNHLFPTHSLPLSNFFQPSSQPTPSPPPTHSPPLPTSFHPLPASFSLQLPNNPKATVLLPSQWFQSLSSQVLEVLQTARNCHLII